MTTRMLTLAMLALTCVATPVAARQTANDTPAPAVAAGSSEAARASEERMVCERRKVVGSNKVERICKTASQWKQDREEAKRASERLLPTGSPCTSDLCAGR
jgi:hypothetical protein